MFDRLQLKKLGNSYSMSMHWLGLSLSYCFGGGHCFVLFHFCIQLLCVLTEWFEETQGRKLGEENWPLVAVFKFNSILLQHSLPQKLSPGILWTLLLLVFKWLLLFGWHRSSWTSSHHSAQDVEKNMISPSLFTENEHILLCTKGNCQSLKISLCRI